MKALCCLYPDEHQFKTMTPGDSSPSTSESGHYNGAGVGWFGPQSPLGTPYAPEGSLSQDTESSGWLVEDSPGPSRRLSTMSGSHYNEDQPYPSDHHNTSLTMPFGFDALPLGHQRTTSWATSDISTEDMSFALDAPRLEGIMEFHDQVPHLPLDMASTPSSMSLHQPGLSPEYQGYFHSPSLDGTQLDANFYPQNSHCADQPTTLDFWNSTKNHEYHHFEFPTSSLEIDDRATYFQSGP